MTRITSPSLSPTDHVNGALGFRRQRAAHWDALAARGRPNLFGTEYHARLAAVYTHLVSPNSRVLEIGCGQGDLLAAVSPSFGLGVDVSQRSIQQARVRHPALRFVRSDGHALGLTGTFDIIILSDLVNDVWDVQQLLEEIAALCHPGTRVLLNTYSRLWEAPRWGAEALGFARPLLPQNWLTVGDLENLLHLAGFENIRHWEEVLWPAPPTTIAALANQVVVRLPLARSLALTNFLVARLPAHQQRSLAPIVSVIIPARNEAGNIDAIFTRTPEMGAGTELVFVEGHSKDHTFEAIQQAITRFPGRNARLYRQTGTGKGDAVRLGFARASGDILMILDADLTVPPEDLPRFYEALHSGKAEFVNGVRLVYPMEKQAMQFLNLIANKLFGMSFSWLLGQSVKDTLCGTKALWRREYEEIARNRANFGDFDPFGDFDLLFGAAKLNLRILDVPIRYRERTYGTTNIQRWRHGLLLFRMLAFAARRLKFV